MSRRLLVGAMWSMWAATVCFGTVAGAMTLDQMNQPENVVVPPVEWHLQSVAPESPAIAPVSEIEAAPAPQEPTRDGVADAGLQGPEDAVQIDTGDGVATTGPGEVAGIATAAALGETDEDYHYRLCMQLQEAKPWIDWGCVR